MSWRSWNEDWEAQKEATYCHSCSELASAEEAGSPGTKLAYVS